MRRLIFRPLLLVSTFLLGLFLTFFIQFAGDRSARLLDDPDDSIPPLCWNGFSSYACSQMDGRKAEEAAVYAALVERMRPEERGSVLVIQDQTVRGEPYPIHDSEDDNDLPDPIFEALVRDFPQADRETLYSFRAVNEQSYVIGDPFLLRTRSKRISRREVEEYRLRPGGWWERFYRNYPGATGFLVFSRVGFNPEMNQALVYRAFSCADTCGYGSYILLAKEGGVWRVKAEAGAWIS